MSRFVDAMERIANRIPSPVVLFLVALFTVAVASGVVAHLGWSVQKQTIVNGRIVVETVRATSLLSSDGAYWALNSMVQNFIGFPATGITIVAMLGIGFTERTGLIGAALSMLLQTTPRRLLTPLTVFCGIMSSIALDAGFVVLPPIAAVLFHRAGREPVVGVVAMYAGVAAGFGANLAITGIDPLLAGFTQNGARILAPGYRVAASCNWWFAIASTFVLSLTGWLVTESFVEPSYRKSLTTEPATRTVVATLGKSGVALPTNERRGLCVSIPLLLCLVGGIWWLTKTPGSPLYGKTSVPTGVDPSEAIDRWISAIVPLLFVVATVAGLAYGLASGSIRNATDCDRHLGHSVGALGQVIAIMFFAAQFIAALNRSRLGEMLAVAGGDMLATSALPPTLLLAGFILMVFVLDMFVGSMSAKYAILAPIFIPLLMRGSGVSPELTQAAYRVGDSVANAITPFNPYVAIVLYYVQMAQPRAGMGTVIRLMFPYTITFLAVWTLLLLAWVAAGVPLGPNAPLVYVR